MILPTTTDWELRMICLYCWTCRARSRTGTRPAKVPTRSWAQGRRIYFLHRPDRRHRGPGQDFERFHRRTVQSEVRATRPAVANADRVVRLENRDDDPWALRGFRKANGRGILPECQPSAGTKRIRDLNAIQRRHRLMAECKKRYGPTGTCP